MSGDDPSQNGAQSYSGKGLNLRGVSRATRPDGQNPPMPADPELAVLFREMRSTLGESVSVAQLAAHLKTRPEVITALEQGDIAALPAWAETARVISSYAGMMKLDGQPILRRIALRINPQLSPAPPVSESKAVQIPRPDAKTAYAPQAAQKVPSAPAAYAHAATYPPPIVPPAAAIAVTPSHPARSQLAPMPPPLVQPARVSPQTLSSRLEAIASQSESEGFIEDRETDAVQRIAAAVYEESDRIEQVATSPAPSASVAAVTRSQYHLNRQVRPELKLDPDLVRREPIIRARKPRRGMLWLFVALVLASGVYVAHTALTKPHIVEALTNRLPAPVSHYVKRIWKFVNLDRNR